jgi:hypothetical protein
MNPIVEVAYDHTRTSTCQDTSFSPRFLNVPHALVRAKSILCACPRLSVCLPRFHKKRVSGPIAGNHSCATMNWDYISATRTYVMWREGHPSDDSVL